MLTFAFALPVTAAAVLILVAWVLIGLLGVRLFRVGRLTCGLLRSAGFGRLGPVGGLARLARVPVPAGDAGRARRARNERRARRDCALLVLCCGWGTLPRRGQHRAARRSRRRGYGLRHGCRGRG